MRCLIRLLLIGFWLLPLVGGEAQNPTIAPTAQEYLEHALDVMQKNALHSERIDWATLPHQALEHAAGAEVPVDTYEAIRWSLKQLNKHSFLQLSPELEKQEEERKRHTSDSTNPVAARSDAKPASAFVSRDKVEGRMLTLSGHKVAYVVVPLFSPRNEADGVRFETDLQRLIAKLDREHPRGWVVDVRGNEGGNMWPMLAGLGPLLGEGICGAFHNADGKNMNWFYRDGKAGYEGAENWTYSRVDDSPYRVPGNPAIAFLIDGETASSGEATAIAFRGRPRTRFFGEHTLGASTNNTNFLLPDGANVILTVGVLVDRNGNEYEDGFAPDVATASPKEILPPDQDETVQAAGRWLASEATP